MNEFYCVNIYLGLHHYFHSKDAAFKYLWQIYLNNYGDSSDEVLAEVKQELNDTYRINGFGEVRVCGFED